ncbi:MAG TPA: peptidoglycan DD-metalloendopeptidase family protein [Pseudonocardiaceae bacterium]
MRIVLVAVLMMLGFAVPAVAAPPELGGEVGAAALERAAGGDWADTRVRVLRAADGWAFGTVVLVPVAREDTPLDWLFVARRSGAAWSVALDASPEFTALTAAAPAAVVSGTEKSVFGTHGGPAGGGAGTTADGGTGTAPDGAGIAANGDLRTGMRLPWALSTSWSLLGGPHAYDAGSGPWSSLDLAGGDQRVLAARAGLAYTVCTGLVRVVHDRGYSTRYYHLWNHIQADGRSVSEGTYLGDTGTETGCGGSARARHVHFSLMQHGAFVGIANHIIGKWLPRNGSAQYGGSALHGSRSVAVGGALYNYGALGFTQGIVDADGDTSVNRRTGPGTGYALAGTVADGATVTIACSANGTTHTGRWGTTSLWNRLTDGTWISDAFLYTGVSTPVNGWC